MNIRPNSCVVGWPHMQALSKNSRMHWAKRRKYEKAYRYEGYVAALSQDMKPGKKLVLSFFAPDARKRDHDNLHGAMKYALDGVAQAVGQDDSEWKETKIVSYVVDPNCWPTRACVVIGLE